MNKLIIISTGFLQVSLVAANTWMISNNVVYGIFIVSFLISLVWSINVKKIAFGSWLDRALYSFGAGSGALFGVYVAKLIAGVKI